MESIALALPLLLALIGWEYWVAKKRNLAYYEFKDSITNLSIAVLDRITALLCAGFFFLIYDFVQKNYGILNIQRTWGNWLILFIVVDFLWYWYHRTSHEVNLFWAVHVVHHSSNEFNLSVGTRITVLQSIVRLLFWIVLPLIGFPAHMIMWILLVQGVYPFFVHTRFIGKLGWIEYVLVTPSHHRVHHASNEQYLDKNYGGVFIVWDRLFGTYAEEKNEIQYGLTKPLTSRSLLWHIFHYFVELYYSFRFARGIRNKVKILVGKPDLIDPSLRPRLELQFLTPKQNSPLALEFHRYIIFQLMASIFSLFVLLFFYSQFSVLFLVGGSLCVIFTLINCGAILEQKSWVFHLEYFRFLLVVFLIFYVCQQETIWIIGIGLIALSLSYFHRLRRMYMWVMQHGLEFPV